MNIFAVSQMPHGLHAIMMALVRILFSEMSDALTWKVATAFLKLFSSNATGWSALRCSSELIVKASSTKPNGKGRRPIQVFQVNSTKQGSTNSYRNALGPALNLQVELEYRAKELSKTSHKLCSLACESKHIISPSCDH
jgi:hypothetical protein